MLGSLTALVIRRRVTFLAIVGVFVVVAAALGGNVAKHLSSGGFNDPGSASARAESELERVFHADQPNLILLVTAKTGTVDDPAVAAQAAALTQRLAATPGISQAASYWTLGSPPPLRSKDNKQALVLARIAGNDDQVRDRIKELSPQLTQNGPVISVGVGGFAEIFRQVGTQIEHDLRIAEMIALPVTLILLILVFGSAVAASLPLTLGVLAIIGGFFVLRLIAAVTQVSIFSLNLATALGLSLAIDYSLFVVSRYREELRNGLAPKTAIVRAEETAGRTVVFSAVTVSASLAALLVFPLAFLRSFAYAGVAVTVLAAVGAVIVLPALLALLGPRIDKLVLWRRKPRTERVGFWHRVATFVMRRPIAVGLSAIALLLVLGSPFLHIRFGLPDDRVLPASASSRQVQQQIRTNFNSQEAGALEVVAANAGAPASIQPQIDAYAAALSKLDGVARVDAATGSYLGGSRVIGPNPSSVRFVAPTGTWLSVVPAVEPMSSAGEHLVHEVRDLKSPFPVQVGGQSAQLVDSKASLFGRIPLALGIIALVTFVALFMFFGSVVMPVKALVLNVLSLTATFGAMVWIFQDGHLSGLLNFSPTGYIDTTTPLIMFCVAFGLSMDYEVFLLSRIKEEHDRTGDNEHSVAVGLERTGAIVTALAGLMAVVFIAFATSQITFIKLFGIGLAMAVLMDATVIRATLVPAFMRLAGELNWWAPPFLRRVYERYGIHEADSADTIELVSPPESEPEPEPDKVIDVREPAAKRASARKAAAKKKTTAKKTTARKTAARKKTATKRATAATKRSTKKTTAKRTASKRTAAKR
jgi:RND superfamily putative drug exporter